MEYRIDASNKTLGRLATEIAILLRGKNNPHFDPAKLSGNKVYVSNTDKLQVTGKKIGQKIYRHHSGYHGGLKEEKLGKAMVRDSRVVLRHAVMGMLPKNRLRSRVIRNMTLAKGDIQ
mgnify:FL=1